MSILAKYRNAMLAGAAAITLLSSFPAAAIPQPKQEGNVRYISGGIGTTEEDALKADAGNYDLAITSADGRGEFMTDTDLTIQSKNGREMVNVGNAGPMFYAELPRGTYKVEATNGNQHQERVITVGSGKPADLHLVWRTQSS